MTESRKVGISPWRPADFDVGGETIFAIGDVHGCAAELSALLATIADLATRNRRRRLVYLGDLIDRGPDSLGALRLWARNAAAHRVDTVDRLMGNHEQLLLLAAGEGHGAEKARHLWLEKGGERMLTEMQTVRQPTLAATLPAAVGPTVVALLQAQRSHVAVGNVIFVHAGIDPEADTEAFLAQPWTVIGRRHWAWIVDEFLTWQGGHDGRIVVHGHTPPDIYLRTTGRRNTHRLVHDQLCLDGGSAVTGVVAAAQIEDGRYRILRTPRRRPAG